MSDWIQLHERYGCVHPEGCSSCSWCGYVSNRITPLFGTLDGVTNEIIDAHRAEHGDLLSEWYATRGNLGEEYRSLGTEAIEDGYRVYVDAPFIPKKVCVTVGGRELWYEPDATCSYLLGKLAEAMIELEELKDAAPTQPQEPSNQ